MKTIPTSLHGSLGSFGGDADEDKTILTSLHWAVWVPLEVTLMKTILTSLHWAVWVPLEVMLMKTILRSLHWAVWVPLEMKTIYSTLHLAALVHLEIVLVEKTYPSPLYLVGVETTRNPLKKVEYDFIFFVYIKT